MATPRTEVTFHFIKSQTYATYHVDGAYGGLTPRGLVSVALYNERFPIPKTQTFAITKAGQLEETPTAEDKLADFVRIVDAELVMSAETAAAIGKWLLEKAKEAGIGEVKQ